MSTSSSSRQRLGVLLAPALVLLLAATAGWGASAAGAAPVKSERPAPALVRTGPPAMPVVRLGVSVPGAPRDLSALRSFEAAAGKRAGLVMWYAGWPYHRFDAAGLRAVADRGSLPVVTWEPWDYRRGVDQPAYRLAAIASGAHDAYVRQWATDAKAYGRPLLLRFAHEMNHPAYPWSEGANGNAPGDYVRAWRHVHDVFRSVGATNVSWVWSPNVVYATSTPLTGLYPGDAYVDWVAADGYNGGSGLPWGGWRTPAQVFDPTLAQLAVIAPTKPVMIGEVSSSELGGSKARWVDEWFAYLARRPVVKAFVWFDWKKEADWRTVSSRRAAAAFASGVSSPRYR